MDYTTFTFVRIGAITVAWVVIAIIVSLIASGRIGKSNHWTLPEHRLLVGGSFLILSGLVAMTLVTWEFDKFIQPAKAVFTSLLFDLKKAGAWDEPTIEMIRASSERSVEIWVRFRDLLNNLILLVSGGVGGGLISQGLIEKHQRRLRNENGASSVG